MNEEQKAKAEIWLKQTAMELKSWSAALMFFDESKDALVCVANYNLPQDWQKIENKISENSFNVKAYKSGEVVRLNNFYLSNIAGATTRHLVTALLIAPIKKKARS